MLSPQLHCDGSVKLDQIYDTHTEGKLHDKIYDKLDKTKDHQPTPSFITDHSGDVTAILGKTALLNCRVTGVGNRWEYI